MSEQENNQTAPAAQEAPKAAVKTAPATLRFVLGEKLGMTQLFDDKGNLNAVSVVKAGPCKVVRVRTEEKDGYKAVALGFGTIKESKLKGELNSPSLPLYYNAFDIVPEVTFSF